MKLEINKSKLNNTYAYILQRAGYKHIVDRNTGKESYVKVLGKTGYPRFHLYFEEDDDKIVFNLHVDQKRPSYKNQKAHSGEYDGSVVEEEFKRIKSLLI